MGSGPSPEVSVAVDLKGHAIPAGNPDLPNRRMALHFLESVGGMFGVLRKAPYLLVYLLLYLLRKSLIVRLKGKGKKF